MSAMLSSMVRDSQPACASMVIPYLETQYAPRCLKCGAEVFVNSETPTIPWFNSCPNNHSGWYQMHEISDDIIDFLNSAA